MRSVDLVRVRLYLVTDSTPSAAPLERFLALAIDAGVEMVQLRERRLDDRALLDAARRCAAVCRKHGARFIVNDRADIALAAGADGVHVGQEDVHPDDVRRIVGPDAIVGLSTHSRAQIIAARETAADYIGVGPVHATPTKPGREPVGLDLVRVAAAEATMPFFAVGGIDASNVSDVVAAGARGVAVVRAVTLSPDPGASVRLIVEAMTAKAASGVSKNESRR